MNRALVLVSAIMIGGCGFSSEPQICETHNSPVFVSAWEEQLEIEGITYVKKSENVLCFQTSNSSEAREAKLSANPVYRGAATIVANATERERLLEYLHSEQREYDEKPRAKGGSFFVVYSGSQAQLEETQVMFSCVQYEKNCAD